MARGTSDIRTEQAATTIEFVGLAVAVVAMLGAVAAGLGGHGSLLGSTVGNRIQQAVVGEPAAGVGAGARRSASEPRRRAVATPPRAATQRRRAWRERRWSGGDEPQHVPRDELRLNPLVDPIAWWQRRWTRVHRMAGIDARIDGRACTLCTALEWSHDVRSGARVGDDDQHHGLEATLIGAARLAIASADATIRANRSFGPVDTSAQGRVRVTLGAEADGEARLRLSRAVQDVQLTGNAMAGAAARTEGQVGIDLLGIAIRNGGRAEGWVGAGARGTAGLRRDSTSIDWRLGWGAALGLGGALEWHGTVDVSGVPRRHRALARSSLEAALRASLLLPYPTRALTLRIP